MLRNLTIFQKGMILVGVPLLVLVLFVWQVWVMNTRQTEAQALASHTKDVIGQAWLISTLIVDEESAKRGFVITSNRDFSEQFDRMHEALPPALTRLSELVADNPPQQQRVASIAAKAAVLSEFHKDVIENVRHELFERALALLKTLEGKRQMDDLRADIAGFVAVEEGLSEIRERAVEAGRDRLRWAFGVGTVASFLGVLALGLVFYRADQARIVKLTNNAHRLASGQELLPRLVGTDELSQVDHAFHEMAKTIRLYGDIVKSVPVGLTIWHLESLGDDRSLRLVDANPCASSLLGVDVRGMFGRTMVEAFPTVTPEMLRTYAEVVHTGKPTEFADIHYGDERVKSNYWSVKAFPLPDKRLGLAFENTSARKHAEEAVRQLNESLEQRVKERTTELAEANRELLQKNQENETFVYSVSHDLRSPLVNLQGFSKELGHLCHDLRAMLAGDAVPAEVRERSASLLDGPMTKSLGFIQSAVLRLSAIIDALLRLSRVGRVAFQWQNVQVKELVRRIVSTLEATITERAATVVVKALPPAWGDPTSLERVFANLVSNALNYLDPGRPGVIEIGAVNSDSTLPGGITYFVKDNGVGIPEAYRTKIFQAFQRLNPGAAPGEGLGLTIVSRIVERHRGRIWLESAVGEGSTFFVFLPRAPGQDA